MDLAPAKVARAMVLLVLGLVMLSLVNSLVGLLGGPVVQVLAVAYDLSLSSWYSAIALLFASILLATIGLARRTGNDSRYARRWAVLAAIFLFLSCDEMLRIHERVALTLVRPTLESLGYSPTGLLYYSWVILYVPLLVVFVLAYLGFWLDLPARTRRLMFTAGALFVGGAVGVEMLNSWYESTLGASPVIVAATHVEEMLEMLGVVVLVYALMDHLGSHLRIRELRLRLRDPASRTSTRAGRRMATTPHDEGGART